MCPKTVFFQFLLGALLLIVLFQSMRTYKNARANFEVFSKLLLSSQISWVFVCIRLEGFYKGRKTVLNYWLLSGKGTDPVEFYIEPRGNLKRQKLICISYPRPTENTFLRGRRLYYADRNFLRRANKEIYTEQEFLGILARLTQAAEIVEKDPERY